LILYHDKTWEQMSACFCFMSTFKCCGCSGFMKTQFIMDNNLIESLLQFISKADSFRLMSLLSHMTALTTLFQPSHNMVSMSIPQGIIHSSHIISNFCTQLYTWKFDISDCMVMNICRFNTNCIPKTNSTLLFKFGRLWHKLLIHCYKQLIHHTG
jgi:hypothetical protein